MLWDVFGFCSGPITSLCTGQHSLLCLARVRVFSPWEDQFLSEGVAGSELHWGVILRETSEFL